MGSVLGSGGSSLEIPLLEKANKNDFLELPNSDRSFGKAVVGSSGFESSSYSGLVGRVVSAAAITVASNELAPFKKS